MIHDVASSNADRATSAAFARGGFFMMMTIITTTTRFRGESG
jgi:hypothetical protein